jgi:hypothetical protein
MTEEIKQEPTKNRQFILETDGNTVSIIKNELNNIELKGICREIIIKLGN